MPGLVERIIELRGLRPGMDRSENEKVEFFLRHSEGAATTLRRTPPAAATIRNATLRWHQCCYGPAKPSDLLLAARKSIADYSFKNASKNINFTTGDSVEGYSYDFGFDYSFDS